MPTLQVARIVVSGRTYRQDQLENRNEARSMLSDAFTSGLWPAGRATITVAPGGFVRAPLPGNYDGDRGWNSRKRDLRKLIAYAEEAVNAVMSGNVLRLARERTRFLTLGIDLNRERQKEERISDDHFCRPTCPRSCTHAELVAVFDTAAGKIIHWTGKSYPTKWQQHSLVHVKDLKSHFLEVGSQRLVVLGCHDLFLFINRGRQSKNGCSSKEKRRTLMRELAFNFRPTMILHHPHSTYSPKIWASPWSAARRALPTARIWVSGIAFCGNPEPRLSWRPWQTLEATRSATASQGAVLDLIVKGYGS